MFLQANASSDCRFGIVAEVLLRRLIPTPIENVVGSQNRSKFGLLFKRKVDLRLRSDKAQEPRERDSGTVSSEMQNGPTVTPRFYKRSRGLN